MEEVNGDGVRGMLGKQKSSYHLTLSSESKVTIKIIEIYSFTIIP